MPTIDFPNSPTVNQQFTAGGKIWQWSGTTWDVVRIAVPAASLTSTDVSRLTGATSNLQTQINTLSTNLVNTLDDYVPIGDVGVADGVASLDATGKIPIAQLGNLIDGAPAALDTLNELAAAINDDSSYAATITTALGNKVSKAGGDIITSSLSSVIPLVLKGTASQSADLQQWHNSAGTLMARVAFDGSFTAGGYNGATKFIVDQFGTLSLGTNRNISGTPTYLFVQSQGATDIGAVIKGHASQTANLLEFQNSGGTAVTFFNASGGLTATEGVVSTLYSGGKMTTGTLGYYNATTFSAAVIPIVVRGVASQTADLQQWQNSAGTVLAKITASGALDATAITVNGSTITGGGLTPVAVSTNITMAANNRYFVDTTSARTLTLPITPALGAEIELYDSSNNAFTNNVSILRNGEKINGLTDNAALDINGFAVSFIYTGSTYGWRIK